MIELHPNGYAAFHCPECSSGRVVVQKSIFAGCHTLADIRCSDCQLEFLQDYPVSHALYHPVSIRKDNEQMSCVGGFGSFGRHLLEDFRQPRKDQLMMSAHCHRECERVVVLNCMDNLYGHVLLKLFNALHYLEHEPDIGLVVLLPRSFEWLVPKGVAEVWTVDVPLSLADRWFECVDGFVQDQLGRFERVYLSLAFSHPEPAGVSIEKFTGVKPFELERYYAEPLQVTFVSREDRLWFPSHLEDVAYRIARRLPVKRAALKIAAEQQDRRFERVAERVAQVLPNARFSMVGLGEPRGLSGVEDLRTHSLDVATEHSWCELYAQSHVVVGVHGSNMLLPTAHAAGYLELLPDDRQPNLLQDIMYPRQGRIGRLLGRFVGERAEPAEVASQILSMYRDFGKQRILMHEDYLKHGRYRDVTRWQTAWEAASTRFDVDADTSEPLDDSPPTGA